MTISSTVDRKPPPPPPPPPAKVTPAKAEVAPGAGADVAAGTPPVGEAPAVRAEVDPAKSKDARAVANAADVAARERVLASADTSVVSGPKRGLTAAPEVAEGGPAPDTSTASPSFLDKAAGIEDMAARNTFVQGVAKAAGLDNPQLSGTATLMPGPVNKRASMGANLAHALDTARRGGTPDDVAAIEQRITERFGKDAVPTFDKALETAKAAGPAPEHGPFMDPRAPYSTALTDALKPVARASILRDHMRGQSDALDKAYADMPAADKAKLDAEVRAVADQKGFVDGATQALKDLGSDVSAAAKLGFDLATDPAAREKLGKDIETLTTALKDPATRDQVIEAIKSELGQGVVDAITNFSDNPAYNTGYLAATVASGGAIGKALATTAKAAKIGDIAAKAADIARRTRVDLPDGNQLNMGVPLNVRVARSTNPDLAAPGDVIDGLKNKALKDARSADVANPKAFVKGTTGDFFKKGAHVHVKVGGREVEVTLKGNKDGGIDFDRAESSGNRGTVGDDVYKTAENAIRLRIAKDPKFREKLRSEIEAALEAATHKSTEQGQVPGAERLLAILKRLDGLE